jgi:hypothetical protein
MSDIVVSKLGIAFTSEAVAVMQKWKPILHQKQNSVMTWDATHDREGRLIVSMGGDFKPQPNTIPDSVANIDFYWYALPEVLDEVRKFCVHATGKAPSHLIDLPKKPASV